MTKFTVLFAFIQVLLFSSCANRTSSLIDSNQKYSPSEIYATDQQQSESDDAIEDIFAGGLNIEGEQNVLTSPGSQSGSLVDSKDQIGYFSQKQVLKNTAQVQNLKDTRAPWDSYTTTHPDGSKYFLSSRKKLNSDETNYYISLYKVHPTKKEQQKIMELREYKMNDTNVEDVFASVSPDGLYYVFTKSADIYSIDLQNKEIRNITNTPGVIEKAPFFQKNQKDKIFYSTGEEKKIASIHANYAFN